MSHNDYPHIDFVVTLHCKVCNDITSLSTKLTTSEASKELKKYLEAHNHSTGMWII